ncbi:hypothetical protein M3Y99_00768900 [Aphelenchoides fujianensis]|nr:hypothetical protein M3Y99_00768900 [Aphelenchoides fujianensis]
MDALQSIGEQIGLLIAGLLSGAYVALACGKNKQKGGQTDDPRDTCCRRPPGAAAPPPSAVPAGYVSKSCNKKSGLLNDDPDLKSDKLLLAGKPSSANAPAETQNMGAAAASSTTGAPPNEAAGGSKDPV